MKNRLSLLFNSLLAIIGLIAVGCTSGQSTTTASLPLSTTQPTFLFFYTDN